MFRKSLSLILILVFTLSVLFAQSLDQKIKQAYQLYNSQNYNYYRKAVSIFEQAIKVEPQNPEYYLASGRILIELGELEKGKKNLEKALSLNKGKIGWIEAWSRVYLGEYYEQKSLWEKAKKEYEIAYNLNATKFSTAFAKGKSILMGWQRRETPHFIFFYPPGGVASKEINSIVNTYEKAFKNITGFLKVNLKGKLRYYLFPSRRDGNEILGVELGYSVPPLGEAYVIYGVEEKATAGHEMTHLISYHIAPTITMDLILREGLAEFLNQEVEDFAKEVRAYKEMGEFVPLVELNASFRERDTQLAYNESAAFVEFLIKRYGIEKFKKLWSYEDALEGYKKVYQKTFKELAAEWEKSL